MNQSGRDTFEFNERAERLISRMLDGEISPVEQAELDALLARDEGLRAALDDYARIDRIAGLVLQQDMEAGDKVGVLSCQPAASPRKAAAVVGSYRGWWLAAAGGILAAAAVVGFSFLTNMHSEEPALPIAPRSGGKVVAPIQPQFIDYRHTDGLPRNRQTDLHRDIIGIRGTDPNVIYILERARQSTRLRPISGDV